MASEQSQKPAPAFQTPKTVAVSMAVIDDALRDLVSRIEQEFETRGAVTPESASELHGLRLGAEQLLAAQIEADQ